MLRPLGEFSDEKNACSFSFDFGFADRFAGARRAVRESVRRSAAHADQSGIAPPPATHGANLSWTASTSASTCLSTSTPACTLTYNVFVGSTSGGESATAFNTAPITGTTYDFAITPTGSIQNFYFVVQAVETIGTVTLTSANSNEVSVSFPALPAAASGLSVSSVN